MQEHRKEHISAMQQNVSYYNKIASRYDSILDHDKNNALIRDRVAALFREKATGRTVLDFGGGTGKDLLWLSREGYTIIFCEPSPTMREIAIHFNQEKLHYSAVTFLDDHRSNFLNWDQQAPFEQKADAVLANFAVINSISSPRLLFKSLAGVTRPGAIMFLLVLHSPFKKRWQSDKWATIASLFSGQTVRTKTRFKDHEQIVYLHTAWKLKKAYREYFEFSGTEHLNGFSLIQLVRK